METYPTASHHRDTENTENVYNKISMSSVPLW